MAVSKKQLRVSYFRKRLSEKCDDEIKNSGWQLNANVFDEGLLKNRH